MGDDGQVDWRDGIEERSRRRRERLVAHRATDHQDAEEWDLEFWQACTPEERLSALVATLVHADLLIILSTVSGLYERGDAKRVIPLVPDADAALAHVQEGMSGVGTGGMGTKLQAASIATGEGIGVIVASGAEPSVVSRALRGEALGTYFPAKDGAGSGARDSARRKAAS